MNGPTIIDDFVPVEVQDLISAIVNSEDMPWFYRDHTLIEPAPNDTPFFTHLMFHREQARESFHFTAMQPLYSRMGEIIPSGSILRSQINLMLRKDVRLVQSPHVDLLPTTPAITALYYINDSDGDTILYEQVAGPDSSLQTDLSLVSEAFRVTPKKGRMVFFRADRYHSSSSPTNVNRRMAINTIITL